MKYVRDRSIARNLTISLVFSVALISVLALGYNHVSALESLRAKLETRSDEFTTLLVDGLGPQIWNFDTEGMESVANSNFQNEFVVSLRIMDSFGNTLFDREKEHDTDILKRKGDIVHQGKELGSVEVSFTPRFYRKDVQIMLIHNTITILVVLTSLFILTGIFLRIFLRRPLADLGEVVKAYGEGDYAYSSETDPAWEFQPLVRVLREMGGRITAQMQELSEAEANYRTIFENTVEGLFQISRRGKVFNVNPAAAKIMGYNSPSDLQEAVANLVEVVIMTPEDKAEIFQTLRGGASVVKREAQLRKKDGKIIWVSFNLRPVFNDNRKFVMAEGSLEDIGIRKKTEQALLEAKEASEEANRLKSEFLSTVSHELRTPMTSVLGFTKLINRDLKKLFDCGVELTEEGTCSLDRVSGNLGIIIAESERLSRLINDVLDLAKMESREIIWNIEVAQPKDIIDRSLSATASLVEGSKVTLVSNCETDLPDVECDIERIIQVLINLISNAVKFTEQGEIISSVEIVPDGLVFSVTDSGAGIPNDQQELIFNKFKQIGDTLENKPVGTGLGLAICKEIIDLHSGRIWVDSTLGEGSRFSFLLPLIQPA